MNLASAGSLENIKRLVSHFYCSPNITLTKKDDIWEIFNSNGKITNTIVKKIKNRYVFCTAKTKGDQ